MTEDATTEDAINRWLRASRARHERRLELRPQIAEAERTAEEANKAAMAARLRAHELKESRPEEASLYGIKRVIATALGARLGMKAEEADDNLYRPIITFRRRRSEKILFLRWGGDDPYRRAEDGSPPLLEARMAGSRAWVQVSLADEASLLADLEKFVADVAPGGRP